MQDGPLENSQVPSRQRDIQIGDFTGRYTGTIDNFHIFKFELDDSSFSLYRAVEGDIRKIHIHGEIQYDCGNELTFQANLEEATVLAIAETIEHPDSSPANELDGDLALPIPSTFNLVLDLTEPEFRALATCAMCVYGDFLKMGVADTSFGKSIRSLSTKVMIAMNQKTQLVLDEGEADAAYQGATNMINVLKNPRPELAQICQEEERPSLIQRLESVVKKLT